MDHGSFLISDLLYKHFNTAPCCVCAVFLASSTKYQLLTHSTPKMLTPKNLEDALGDILSKANEVEVKNVIGAFDSAKTDKINIVNLCAAGI